MAGKDEQAEQPAPEQPIDSEIEQKEKEKRLATLEAEIAAKKAEAAATANEMRKNAAETESAIAKANKEAREAELPKGETKPLEGKTEVDEKFGYLAEAAAYRGLRRIAKEIGNVIKGNAAKKIASKLAKDDKLLVTDKLDVAVGDLPLLQIREQFRLFDALLEAQISANQRLLDKHKTLPEAEPLTAKSIAAAAVLASAAAALPFAPALAAAPLVVSTLADVVGYFRVDYSIKGQDFELANDAVAASVAGQLQLAEHEVYMEGLYLVTDSDLIKKQFVGLVNKRTTLAIKKQGLSLNVLTRLVSKLAQEQDALKKAQLEADIEEVKAEVTKSDSVITESDAYFKSITSVSQEQPKSLLAQAAIREQLHKRGITHILYVHRSSSGGEALTRRGLFAFGSRTAFMGASVITYILATRDGKILASDALIAADQLDYGFGSNEVATAREIHISA